MQLMTDDEAGRFLGVSTRTLRRWRKQRKGPTWSRIGQGVRYTQDALDRYVREQEGTCPERGGVLGDSPVHHRCSCEGVGE